MRNPRQNSNRMKAPCGTTSGVSIHIQSALYFVYWSTWLQNLCWIIPTMMNSIHHAVPLNAILRRQDEVTNESIAKVLDYAVARFMQAIWASSLILHGSIILVTETYCPILHGNHMPCNTMDYTNETVYSSSKFVFDTTQYPCPPTGSSLFASATPSSTPFSGSGWLNLKGDIQKAAINNGFVLFSNGGEKENRKQFWCNHNVIYRGESTP
jgi:hypothetical protein